MIRWRCHYYVLVIAAVATALSFIGPTQTAQALTVFWSKSYSTSTTAWARAFDVAVGPGGTSVYVTGEIGGGVDGAAYGSITIRYDAVNGATSTGWPVFYKSASQPFSNAAGMGLAVDGSGNAYMTGVIPWGSAMSTLKFGPTGGTPTLFEEYLGSAGAYGDDLKLDPASTVAYVAGTDSNVTQFIRRYNTSNGSFINSWAEPVITGWTTPPTAHALAVDGAGNVYSAGGSGTSFYVRKRTAAGSIVWTKNPGSGSQAAYGIDVDNSSSYVYVAAVDQNVGKIFKLSASTGNTEAGWPVATSGGWSPFDIEAAPNGNLYVVGSSGGNFVTQVYSSANGSYLDGASAGTGIGYGVAADSSSNIYVTGRSGSAATSYLTIKYGGTCTGPLSFGLWTDNPTVTAGATPVKAVHISELRSRIDTLRIDAGLTTYLWTDNPLTVGTAAKAQHIADLRTALSQVYTTCGQVVPTWTDNPLGAGVAIKAQHINELRSAVLSAK